MVRELLFAMVLSGPGQPGGLQVINPLDYAPCGLNSLYAVNAIRGAGLSYEELRQALGPADARNAHSMADVVRAAEQVGMIAAPYRLTWAELKMMPMPAILVLQRPNDETRHFVVCVRAEEERAVTFDPPNLPRDVPREALELLWTGHAIVFPRTEAELAGITFRLRWLAVSRIAVPVALVGACVVGLATWLARRRRSASTLTWSGRALFRGSVLMPLGLIVSLAAAAVAWPMVYRPRCECDTRIDLGELPTGVQRATVRLRNSGRAPLEIRGVKSTCGCAVVQPPSMIAAGAEVDVPIQLSVVRGPQSAQLSVDTNDPDGAKTIGLRWFGQSPVEVRPKAVYSGGEPSHREFVRELVAPYVDGPGAKPPKLVETACGSGRVSVEVVGHRPAGLPASYGVTTVRRVGECILQVTVRPPDGPADFHDTVALTFQVGDASHRVDVPIRVRFSGSSLVADAGEVVFAAGRPAELLGQERTVEVRSWFGPPRCESVPTWLTWRVESCGEERYRMHFTVAAPPPGAEPQQQALIVTSGRPSDAPIGMTVRWYAGAPTRNSDVVPP
jgi:hypothetical protein